MSKLDLNRPLQTEHVPPAPVTVLSMDRKLGNKPVIIGAYDVGHGRFVGMWDENGRAVAGCITPLRNVPPPPNKSVFVNLYGNRPDPHAGWSVGHSMQPGTSRPATPPPPSKSSSPTTASSSKPRSTLSMANIDTTRPVLYANDPKFYTVTVFQTGLRYGQFTDVILGELRTPSNLAFAALWRADGTSLDPARWGNIKNEPKLVSIFTLVYAADQRRQFISDEKSFLRPIVGLQTSLASARELVRLYTQTPCHILELVFDEAGKLIDSKEHPVNV